MIRHFLAKQVIDAGVLLRERDGDSICLVYLVKLHVVFRDLTWIYAIKSLESSD
jgi:hypothetical protein